MGDEDGVVYSRANVKGICRSMVYLRTAGYPAEMRLSVSRWTRESQSHG